MLGSLGFAAVDGASYIRQRIATALGEPYGDDEYHPLWGSTLESFIGTPITSGTSALVSSEVSRVLQHLISAQQAQVTASALAGTRSVLSAADVIATVDSVSAAVGADPEIIQVVIALTTQAGAALTVTRTVTS